MTVELPDLAAMEAFGARIAGLLRAGDVVALSGGLGAGKTTLSRSILAALGYSGEVPSPTFTIVETYDPPAVRLPVVHADFYRLEDPSEAEEVGLDDAPHLAVAERVQPVGHPVEHRQLRHRTRACLSVDRTGNCG